VRQVGPSSFFEHVAQGANQELKVTLNLGGVSYEATGLYHDRCVGCTREKHIRCKDAQ
jgi:hypothetical protein